MDFDLKVALPHLLPSAIAWAETQSRWVADEGLPLSEPNLKMAREVGVREPELVRVMVVEQLPLPDDSFLRTAALQTDLLGRDTVGLTLGHSILVVRGALDRRLLSHELRHVHQYEWSGSIKAFLSIYLQQIIDFGYANAPLEVDARAHER